MSSPIDNSGNALAALVAVVSATGASVAGQALCASLLDQAADVLRHAPGEVIGAIGGRVTLSARRAGQATLDEICGQCRLCPRGRGLPDDGERAGLGPVGGQKWRKRV